MERRGAKFDDDRLLALPNLARESEIMLVNTSVSDAGIKELAKLPRLTSLMIYGGAKITDRGVSHLRNCLGLREFTCRGQKSPIAP
jgi:hypothetical protein